MAQQNSFSKEELILAGTTDFFGEGNSKLPADNMLMMDRIIQINDDGGEYGKGEIIAELDINPDLWFFDCHFKGDPVMPGCLGLDAMWQLVGFYLAWSGGPGHGRALGVGEVKFTGQILPTAKKVTYKIDEDPKSVLNRFRNLYSPRIAVTVDMIATGTDVKPLEVLLFMRDVKSKNYFEQMKGRGTRTIDSDTLQLVSKTAQAKTHFVIVDAVGVCKSKKTDSRPLERQPTVALKDLLGAVTMGVAEEDLFLSLANRLIRLDKQITEPEKQKLLELSGGKNLKQITKELLSAYDPDAIEQQAQAAIDAIPKFDQTPALINQAKQNAQEQLIAQAAATFNGELNNYLDNVRREHEQMIDSVNLDTIIKSEWDTTSVDNATAIVKDFSEYLEQHKDEIKALSIFYNQAYQRRDITFKMIKDVLEKLQMDKPLLAPHTVWDAYSTLENVNSKRPKDELTALVSLIRKACGIDTELKAYDKTIESNFKNWIFKQNAGQHNRFTPEQISWLRMIKDHIMSSYHIALDDLDYNPFDAQGGRGKMHQLFGTQMNEIIDELNEVLAA